jgi:hypothetical protein
MSLARVALAERQLFSVNKKKGILLKKRFGKVHPKYLCLLAEAFWATGGFFVFSHVN